MSPRGGRSTGRIVKSRISISTLVHFILFYSIFITFCCSSAFQIFSSILFHSSLTCPFTSWDNVHVPSSSSFQAFPSFTLLLHRSHHFCQGPSINPLKFSPLDEVKTCQIIGWFIFKFVIWRFFPDVAAVIFNLFPCLVSRIERSFKFYSFVKKQSTWTRTSFAYINRKTETIKK